MNKLIPVLLSATTFLLTACEYEPDGKNFVELTPPGDSLQVEISLNDVDPSDTIYLYQNTSISIKIDSPKDLQNVAVIIDGREYTQTVIDSLSFIINPDRMFEGVHKMTVKAVFYSGTGSLAEMMGLEGYLGELTWAIRVFHKPIDRFQLGYRINGDGFLEVFWDNVFPVSFIEKYLVHAVNTQDSDIIINDASKKYFVDYGYVCGSGNYEVTTYLKDGSSLWKPLSFNKPAPEIFFENLGSDKLRVYWNKPFANGRFNLLTDDSTLTSGIHDTTITIPQIFGKSRRFTLETGPQNAGYDLSSNKFKSYGFFTQGTSLNLPNWPLYAYNIKDNIIYTSKYSNLVAFDAATMQQINIVSIAGHPWGLIYGGKIACAPHKSTVAAMTGEETWIFPDSRFIDQIIIPSLPGSIHTRLSALTSDDRFFVVQRGTNVCKIYNTLTGEEIFEFTFTYKTRYDIPDLVAVSENGKYFCASSESGIEIFEIDGTATSLLYTDTREYRGAIFVPSQPDRLLLRVGSGIELHQMPGFELIQSLDVSAKGAAFCNIDPASKNLLYYQSDSLKVCKVDKLNETIFKIRSNATTCKMLNNKLLTYGSGGIYFDITPYLNQ